MKTILLFLMVVSFGSFKANNDCWEIKLGKKVVACGLPNTTLALELDGTETNTLKILTPKDVANKKVSLTVLVMNKQRNTLLTKNFNDDNSKIEFEIAELKAATKGQSFDFYTVASPKNPEEAMNIRIAPKLLCSVSWK